jgi:hypothetical protein
MGRDTASVPRVAERHAEGMKPLDASIGAFWRDGDPWVEASRTFAELAEEEDNGL